MIASSWIADPMPVWEEIKAFMVDDIGELERVGRFIGVSYNDELAGAFLVKPWTTFCWEIHGGVRRRFWGMGKDMCLESARFLFRNTPCIKLVAIIPEFNKLMRKCVINGGMTQEGKLTKSFVKGMKTHDQYIYGITRGEILPCLLQ